MKKIFLAVAAIATMASCSKTEVDTPSFGNKLIGFSNLNDKVTRSANDAGSDYQVYAKTNLSGETDWFINEAVSDADAIKSGKKYYWPELNTVVDFYSFAPASSTSITITDTYSALSVAYVVPATANEDFTVAKPIKRTVAETNPTVDFQFSHMLSKITVASVLNQELIDADYTIDFTSADFSVKSNSATVNPVAAAADWSGKNVTTATYSGAKSYMVMPQTSTDCTVQLKGVTIKKGTATVFEGDMKAYLIKATNVTGDNFVKGSHYKLTLTISSASTDGDGKPVFGDEIKFSADLAADWTTVDSPLTQD